MKQRPKGILALCTALLLVLLGGCQGEGRAAFTQDCVLSLQAGSTTAVVSGTRTDGSQAAGETVSLAQPPLVEGETFWLPLEAVVAALGGTCQVEGDTATVRWLDQTVVYTIGAPGAQRNGTDWLPEDLPAFQDPAQTLPPEAVVPQVREGVWYLPLALAQPLLYGGTLWTQPTQDPAAGLVILGRERAADLTLGGFSLASRPQWEDLPADLTRGMAETGRQPSATGEPYDGVCWTGDGVACWVLQPQPGGPDWQEAGTLCGVELTTGDQATPRGLKVGDTLALAQLLYGPLVDLGHGIYQRAEPFGSAVHLCFQVQDQTITKIGLYNNLWGMEGYVPPSANRALPQRGRALCCSLGWPRGMIPPLTNRPCRPRQRGFGPPPSPRRTRSPLARPRWTGRSGGRRRGRSTPGRRWHSPPR